MAKFSEMSACTLELPFNSGDGYSYGGGCVLKIGNKAFQFGEGRANEEIAKEVARLWNEAHQTKEQSE